MYVFFKSYIPYDISYTSNIHVFMILIKKKFEFQVKRVGQIMGRGEKGMVKYKGWGAHSFYNGRRSCVSNVCRKTRAGGKKMGG